MISDWAATVRAWGIAAVLAARDAHGIYHPPSGGEARDPSDRELAFRPFSVVTSRDRVTLRGWVVLGEGPHTVLVCHGMGRTKSAVLDHVELLHRAGHHVVAYDLRNHGQSGRDGRWRRMADRFTSDLIDVVRAVRADALLGGGKLAVLAFSFSTWPAIYALRAGDHEAKQISAVICDSGPLFDIPGGFARFSGLRWGTVAPERRRFGAFRVYRTLFVVLSRRMLGVRGWPPRLPADVARLFFIAGGKDRMVPADEVLKVADVYPAAQRWVAAKAMHMTAVRAAKEEYRHRIVSFLSEAFTTEAARAS